MQEVFVTKKEKKTNKQEINELTDTMANFICSRIFSLMFGLVLFPYWWFTVGRKVGGFMVALGLFFHERKEFKPTQAQLERYPDLPKKGCWTNPEFLTEKEKTLYERKKLFFPEG